MTLRAPADLLDCTHQRFFRIDRHRLCLRQVVEGELAGEAGSMRRDATDDHPGNRHRLFRG